MSHVVLIQWYPPRANEGCGVVESTNCIDDSCVYRYQFARDPKHRREKEAMPRKRKRKEKKGKREGIEGRRRG